MLLSGDIEINPGPVRQSCTICTKPVNKRSLFCNNCNVATHKQCVQLQILDTSKYLCDGCGLSNLDFDPNIFPFSNSDAVGSMNIQPIWLLIYLIEPITEEIPETEIWLPFKTSWPPSDTPRHK